jgi:hypothetical protein
MNGTFGVIMILIIYLVIVHKKLRKDKREARWVYVLTFGTMGLSLFLSFNNPLGKMTIYLNATIGALTEWVIK